MPNTTNTDLEWSTIWSRIYRDYLESVDQYHNLYNKYFWESKENKRRTKLGNELD